MNIKLTEVHVVDGEAGRLVWYLSADTLKLTGRDSSETALSLSRPVSDVFERFAEVRKKPVWVTRSDTLHTMVRLMRESSAHRIWVVDAADTCRPVGVVMRWLDSPSPILFAAGRE